MLENKSYSFFHQICHASQSFILMETVMMQSWNKCGLWKYTDWFRVRVIHHKNRGWCKWTNKKVNGSANVCLSVMPHIHSQVWLSHLSAGWGRWDIKRSVPWQGSPSMLGRTVAGVMFWQGIKCLLHRRPVWHTIRLMDSYRLLYNGRLWEWWTWMPWLTSCAHLCCSAND